MTASPRTRSSAPELAVGALVEDVGQFLRDVFPRDLLAFFKEQHHSVISFRGSQAVDAAHRSDNQRVAAFE